MGEVVWHNYYVRSVLPFSCYEKKGVFIYHKIYMKLALDLAASAKRQVSPNLFVDADCMKVGQIL